MTNAKRDTAATEDPVLPGEPDEMLQPLVSLGSPVGTHLPDGSHAVGATQSSAEAQLGLHVPLLSHL